MDHYKANIISSVQVASIILAPGAGSLINLVPAESSPCLHLTLLLVSDEKKIMYNARNICPEEQKFRHFQNCQIFGSF